MVRIDVVKQSFPLKKDKDLLSKTGNIKPSNSNNNPYATLPLNAFKTNIVSIKNISFKGFSTQDADNAYNIASYNITRGRFNEAEKLLNKALTAYLQKGDDNASLKTLNKLTMVKIRQGKYQDAQKYIEKADKFAKEPVNIHTADLYRNKGFLAAINNDSSKAKSWLSHAINIYDSLGEKAKLNKAEALCYVGVLHSTNEDVMDIPKAGKAFSESIFNL